MAQNTDFDLSNEWTLVTDSDVTELRIQNIGYGTVFLKATVGATPPANDEGSVRLPQGTIIASNYTLAELFPGIVGANRLYARGHKVSVSHA